MGEHGVFTREELRAEGSDRAIRRAVHAERLRRLRPGWYAEPGADEEVAAAVTAGGALTCMSVLGRQKVWVPESARGVHVRLTERYRQGPHTGYRACGGAVNGPIGAVDDPTSALLAAVDCVHGDELTAVLDSLLHRRVFQPGELAGLLRGQPRRVRRALAGVDAAAESGTETQVRLHLRRSQLPYRTQVFIPGVGRVDLLVDRSLVIECDSEEHHAGEAIETDRERDLALKTLGFAVLRVSYQQVFHQFPKVAAAVTRMVSDRDHLRKTDYVP